MLIVMCSAVTRNKRKERKVEGTPPPEEKREQNHQRNRGLMLIIGFLSA